MAFDRSVASGRQGLFIAGLDFLKQLLARRMPVLLFLHRCSNSPTAAPAFARATKSVTCFGSRRGAAVLGEQNALVAMAASMH